MEEETELAAACRTLRSYAETFGCPQVDLRGLPFSGEDGSGGGSGVQAGLGGTWQVDRTAGAAEDLLALMREVQSFPEGIAHLLSQTDRPESPGAGHGVPPGFAELFFTTTCSAEDSQEDAGPEGGADTQWGVKMQDTDWDPFICPDLGEIPDDLSEYLNDDYLKKFVVDTDVLFNDPSLECEEELSTCSALPMHPDEADVLQQEPSDKTGNRRDRRRKRAPPADEDTPSRPKRQRAAGRPKTVLEPAEPSVPPGSQPRSAETAGLSAPPPRILHLHPSIQFIPIPDAAAYQVVRALRVSHPVINLPLPNTAATPTYILVPAASPPFRQQVPPLSPMDGAVAPVRMSSSPLGSLSDTASKAVSPTRAPPPSPSDEMKESAVPLSPAVLDVPQVVKDYILEAKEHVRQSCQGMESHYVDVQVSQKEILHSGKNTNKVLEKELVIAGDTDRQKSLLGHIQMFKGSKGDKPKSFVLLLGNAGMGKTTLIRKLCLDWSRNCLLEFDFVFSLDGKALSLPETSHSLQTLLLNFSSLAPACTDPEAVYAQILAAPKRVLVIFDGFDEVRDYEILLQTQEKDLITSLHKDSKAPAYTVRQLYSAILQRVLLPGCTLLLATRPRGSASQLLRRTDSLLEVCGFNPANVETYLTQYFADRDLGAAAVDTLKSCSYLQLLCWNPALCRLVCLVLEHRKGLADLPRTLTGLCHRVLCLKLEGERRRALSEAEPQSGPSAEETQSQISGSSPANRRRRNARSGAEVRTRSRTQSEKEEDGVDGEEMKSVGGEVDRTERALLSQLSSLAWKGVKANSSILSTELAMSAKLKAFGQRTGLFLSYRQRTRPDVTSDGRDAGGGEDGEETGTQKNGKRRGMKGRAYDEDAGASEEHFLLWADPFLQSYLAAIHLSLSRTVTDRAFLQTLPFHPGQKERRRPHREELDLTQRFAVGLLFHDGAELQRLRSSPETSVRDMVAAKQALVTRHLEGLSHGDLSPAQVLEACHHVYEASCTHDGGGVGGGARLVAHLAANLPEVLTFHGVPLTPSDVFAVRKVLERGGREGRSFCLDLEDSGIQIPGLRALVGLNNIITYRACIADVISLWEQLEQSGEEVLLRETVSKFKIHPLKATRACHVEHLAKLVHLHARKRLSPSSSQSDSILSEGVPAVKELHKLEFELGPEKCAPVLSQLWQLLPGLQNLQHLDMENSKIGDGGAEKLADALVHLGSLEILNLSQNCIGNEGVKKLAITLGDLPKLHGLSLYSNEISDEGAESLAAALPQAPSLTDLDLEYNKLTDVGAQSLGASLRNCKKMKTLRMWNQCIPYGVFERLQQQDNRIHWQ
ncbi:ciita [Pungitius sinensis]